MTNKFRALVLHIIYVILTMIFLVFFVITAKTTGPYLTSPLGKILIIFLLLSGYIGIGILLDANKSKKYDFYYGSFISIVGIVLWVITISITKGNLTEITQEATSYWIIFNSYIIPIKFILFLLNVPITPILLLVMCILPTIIIGIGLRIKRRLILNKVK